jgi:acyl carrier protein
MTNQEIINLIEDTLEIDLNTLSENSKLLDIEEYDSMAKLSIIVLSDDEFNKKLTGETIKNFKTIGDIVNFLKS